MNQRLILLVLSAACADGGDAHQRHLVLNSSGARDLGLAAGDYLEVDSSRVPAAAHAWTSRLRGEVGGASSESVRFYAVDEGHFLALIPSRSFEGEDPHVLAAVGNDGRPTGKVIIHSYGAVDVYCPASGAVDPRSWARDSTDGCRYITVPYVKTEAPPSAAARTIKPIPGEPVVDGLLPREQGK